MEKLLKAMDVASALAPLKNESSQLRKSLTSAATRMATVVSGLVDAAKAAGLPVEGKRAEHVMIGNAIKSKAAKELGVDSWSKLRDDFMLAPLYNAWNDNAPECFKMKAPGNTSKANDAPFKGKQLALPKDSDKSIADFVKDVHKLEGGANILTTYFPEARIKATVEGKVKDSGNTVDLSGLSEAQLAAIKAIVAA